MYSRIYLGMLALVAIIPVYNAATSVTIKGCSSDDGCPGTGGVTTTCCLPPPVPVPSTSMSSLVPKVLVPSVCAPTGSMCCSNNTQCPKPSVSADGNTVSLICCESLRICVPQTVCTDLMCKTNADCNGDTCCTTTAAVTGLGSTVSTPASGVCVPDGLTTTACNILK